MVASTTLTPAEIFYHVIQRFRGFASSSGSTADALRRIPATVPGMAIAGDSGHGIGKGFETFAGIQVVNRQGKSVGLAADFFDGGGPDNHGEARAIRGLRGLERPGEDIGGKLMVVVEKEPCPICTVRLLSYARDKQISEIESYLPTRQSMTSLRLVSP
jgi:tRNA(Arg) A34 adenosine deaminase TadA